MLAVYRVVALGSNLQKNDRHRLCSVVGPYVYRHTVLLIRSIESNLARQSPDRVPLCIKRYIRIKSNVLFGGSFERTVKIPPLKLIAVACRYITRKRRNEVLSRYSLRSRTVDSSALRIKGNVIFLNRNNSVQCSLLQR